MEYAFTTDEARALQHAQGKIVECGGIGAQTYPRKRSTLYHDSPKLRFGALSHIHKFHNIYYAKFVCAVCSRASLSCAFESVTGQQSILSLTFPRAAVSTFPYSDR